MAQQKPPAGGITPDSFMAQQPSKAQPGWLDKDIPLDSYGDATLSGLQSIGRGFRSVGRSAWEMAKPPQNTAEWASELVAPGVGPAALRGNKSLLDSVKQAGQVPAAIGDINQSPDPLGLYAKAAQDTAGEGAAQAVTALATEGAARGAPKLVDAMQGVEVAPKVKALAKVGAQEAVSHVPFAGRLVRRPSLMDYVDAARAKAPTETAPIYRDATSQNAPYAGEPPTAETMQDWWKSRGGTLASERPNGPLRAPRATPSVPESGGYITTAGPEPAINAAQPTPSQSGEVTVVGGPKYPAGRNIDLSPGMQTPGGAVVAPRIRGLLPRASAEQALPTQSFSPQPIAEPAPVAAEPVSQPAGSPYTTDAPVPNRPFKEPTGRSELLENKSLQEQVREAAGREQSERIRQSRAQYAPRTKGSLIDDMNEALGKSPTPEKPVKFTKTPGIKYQGEPTAFRSRDVGEQGIPYRPESPAQATASEPEAQNFMEGRESTTGKPQEVVGVDLSKAPGFSVAPGPNNANWFKFHGDVPEEAVTPRLIDQIRESSGGDLTDEWQAELDRVKAGKKKP